MILVISNQRWMLKKRLNIHRWFEIAYIIFLSPGDDSIEPKCNSVDFVAQWISPFAQITLSSKFPPSLSFSVYIYIYIYIYIKKCKKESYCWKEDGGELLIKKILSMAWIDHKRGLEEENLLDNKFSPFSLFFFSFFSLMNFWRD